MTLPGTNDIEQGDAPLERGAGDVLIASPQGRSLRESEERFRQLAENAREVFWLLEVPGGQISYVNPAYEVIFGRTCQSLYDDPEDWYQAIHPEDSERVVAAYEAAASGAYDEEYRIIYPDGSVRWIRDRSVPVRDATGKIIRVAGIAEEITARRRSEDALRATYRALLVLSRCNEALVRAPDEQALLEEVCRVIVEEGGYRICWVGLVEHDERRTIRPVARAGLDEGYVAALDLVWSDTERGRGPTGTAARTLRPVVGRDFLTDPLLAPWRDEALKRGFRSLAALPMVVEGACLGVLTMHAGEPGAFGDEELRFLERVAENLAFGVAAHRARAERDRLTVQLAQADRLVAMGTLAAGVAHEINNPLTYVVAALDHLHELLGAAPAGLPEAVTLDALGVLAEAREGTERVRLIVRDLRTLSRVEETRVEPVELLPVIDFAIGMSRNELKHRARLLKDYGPVPPVRANAAKLGQVFLNLLINAAQAIPAGRVELNEVRVTTSTDPQGRARIEVRDTGAGIAPEVAGRLFEPFFTTKRHGRGDRARPLHLQGGGDLAGWRDLLRERPRPRVDLPRLAPGGGPGRGRGGARRPRPGRRGPTAWAAGGRRRRAGRAQGHRPDPLVRARRGGVRERARGGGADRGRPELRRHPLRPDDARHDRHGAPRGAAARRPVAGRRHDLHDRWRLHPGGPGLPQLGPQPAPGEALRGQAAPGAGPGADRLDQGS